MVIARKKGEKKMRLGFINDIHIDINYKFGVIDAVINMCRINQVDALAIAGDISNEIALSKSFVSEVSNVLGIPVYSVNGNHEFYDQPFSNENYSDGAIQLTENTTLLTTTGWYDYSWYSEGRVDLLKKGKYSFSSGRWADHRYINWNSHFTGDPCINYARDCVENLRYYWQKNSANRYIVMLHMVPHISLLGDNPNYYYTNPFFGSEQMSNLIFNEIKPEYVLYGHTHTANDKMVDGVRCICRPLGYSEYEWNNLDEKISKIFEVLEIE